MSPIIRENWSKFTAFAAIAAVATVAIAWYSYGLLVSPAQLVTTRGLNESYYWTVAQYQIQFERLDNQVIHFASGTDPNIEAIKLRHQVLHSKFNVLTSDLFLTEFFVKRVPAHKDSVDKLRTFMAHVDNDLEVLSTKPELAGQLVGRFDEMRGNLDELSNAVRFAEMKHREATVADFTEKRSKLFATVMVLWAMFIGGLGLYMLNYFRAKLLIAQSEASILAEKKAEAALADAIFTKNTILGTISHELKTPLQTIISSIDLLVMRMVSQRDLEVVERLTSAAARLEARMEDLTDYARLGAGKLELRRMVFDPGELLERVVDEFKGAATTGGLDLVLRRKKRVVLVASDALRFEQIATNLITNAIKYTPSGRIQVTVDLVSSNGEKLNLIVEDTGPGISADNLPALFEPFTQLDQSRARKYDGAGMGLAIVQRLVELFGGTIEVQSIVGRGTRFEVVLPVELISGDLVEPEHSRADIPEHHRILLVDDNAEVRLSVKEVLTEIGYVCDAADSGKVALQKLATHSYDAILMDISMPGMDGFEVAAAVRATVGKNQHVPIVALSAHSPEVVSSERSVPFSAHVTKPVRIDMLRNIMDGVLGKGMQNELADRPGGCR